MTAKQKIALTQPALIVLMILLASISFLAGSLSAKLKNGSTDSTTSTNDKTAVVFASEKTKKPTFQFFVMSFCPFGNQAEDAIKPVAELLGDAVEWKPQYIFSRIDNLQTYCNERSGDPTQCSTYIQSGYFKTEAECKDAIAANKKTCLDDSEYLKATSGVYYSSLHGRGELNQNVREICAWNQLEDKAKWWAFVDNVNKNCTSENVDACWESEAKKAEVDTEEVKLCFNEQAVDLIDKEIAEGDKYQAFSSPTVLINGQAFPPDEAYDQAGKATLKIGKNSYTQGQYRTPEVIKQAVCASFDKAPNACKTELNDQPAETAASGDCG